MQKQWRRAMLRVAACESDKSLAQIACDALAGEAFALVRLWRPDPPSGFRLAGSAGTPTGGGSYHRIDGTHSQVTAGAGKIGRIGLTKEALVVADVRGDEEWLTNPGWIARQGIRGFAGLPLLVGERVLGVLALFARAPLAPDTVDDLSFIADFLAIRLDALSRTSPVVMTRQQMKSLERRAIETALRETHGRVFGANGAAVLLGMKPTTLASRIKVLRIQAP